MLYCFNASFKFFTLSILFGNKFEYLFDSCSELGKNIVLDNFEGSIVTFKSSGALYPIQVNLLCESLHKLLNEGLWSKALALCRRIQVHI